MIVSISITRLLYICMYCRSNSKAAADCSSMLQLIDLYYHFDVFITTGRGGNFI